MFSNSFKNNYIEGYANIFFSFVLMRTLDLQIFRKNIFRILIDQIDIHAEYKLIIKDAKL